MGHFYFDIETTGLDPFTSMILTVQYQQLDIDTGCPKGPLNMLTVWGSGNSERKIVSAITSLLMDPNPFNFVPIGNNLTFDFKFLAAKISQHLSIDVDTLYFLARPHIDLKHVLVILNGGRFAGYQRLLAKEKHNDEVPQWFTRCEFAKIEDYVKKEAETFIIFYSKLREQIRNLCQRRLDNYV